MGIAINLDKDLIKEARAQSKVLHRSVPKQIEHWARIGHIAEDNPDLTYAQIKDILLGLQDQEEGNVKKYKRGMFNENKDN
ncbi:MAG: hypothetical protein ACD_60C00137G0014 [uncultured bacterium]|nr:MAG: hypothetical protein ACD_60C00137G0014 [uncultured bacterium]